MAFKVSYCKAEHNNVSTVFSLSVFSIESLAVADQKEMIFFCTKMSSSNEQIKRYETSFPLINQMINMVELKRLRMIYTVFVAKINR